MDAVRFTKIADIPAFPDEYAPVTHAVADDGTLLFLFVELKAKNAVFGMDRGPAGSFARTRMETPARFRLVRVRKEESVVVELPLLDLTFPLVDVFPNGKVLLAGARSQWRSDEDYDLNGVVCDPLAGSAVRILLGDGIARVSIDGRGLIWVSYYDEGIYGNFGWGSPGPKPVGAAGLACFSEAGEKIWDFPEQMDDCYALNVSGAEAVAYHYASFPICRISSDFVVTRWTTELRGCAELAVTRSKALLSGQYDDPPGIAYLGTLDGDELSGVQRVRLLLSDGSEIPKGRYLGRGRHLYCFADSAVYRGTLELPRRSIEIASRHRLKQQRAAALWAAARLAGHRWGTGQSPGWDIHSLSGGHERGMKNPQAFTLI